MSSLTVLESPMSLDNLPNFYIHEEKSKIPITNL